MKDPKADMFANGPQIRIRGMGRSNLDVIE